MRRRRSSRRSNGSDKEIEADLKAIDQGDKLAVIGGAARTFREQFDTYINQKPKTGNPEQDRSFDQESLRLWEGLFTQWRVDLSKIWAPGTWAENNMGENYSTLGILLSSANLYMNYCKLGIGIDFNIQVREYERLNKEKEPGSAGPDKPDEETFKQGPYYKFLVNAFDDIMPRAKKLVDAVNAGVKARTDAVNAVGTGTELIFAIDRAQAYDKLTKEKHLELLAAPDGSTIDTINQTYKLMTEAEKGWKDFSFPETKSPKPNQGK